MKLSLSVVALGCAVVALFTGCATSLPITDRDRGLMVTAREVFPTLPDRARQVESVEKKRWIDGSVDLTYSYRGRHDGVPVLLYSSVGSWPTLDDAAIARIDGDSDHRRLLYALEQRDADTFVPVGPGARTNLLFAGMQPVGLSFSTQIGTETYAMLCLAPPQFFNAHRTRELLIQRIERLRTAIADHQVATKPKQASR